MHVPALLTVLLLTCTSPSAQVSLFQGSAGLPGDVVVLGALERRPPELAGIVLLPLECAARTHLDEYSPLRARRVADVPGASRLLLPHEQGSLYRFRRPDAQGAAYGYFLVDADGQPRVLIERRGTGLSGTDDPFPRRVALSADGRSLLVASSPAAGGDVFELDLASGTVFERTRDLDPLEVQRNGMMLLDGFGVVIGQRGILRFGRGPLAQAEPLAMPDARSWFGPDLAASADGSTVAFLWGEDASKALVCVLGASGAPRPVSAQPMEIANAGYLPEVEGGPALALSSDGSFVAWRTSNSAREAYVRETGFGPRTPEIQLSGDATLESTLNDTGVLAFFDADSLLMGAGRQGSLGVERADLFRIDLTRGSASFAITNLTRTSGQTAPPFDYGRLRAGDGIHFVPGGGGALILHERRDDKRGFLRWLTPAGDLRTLLGEVESLDSLALAGSYLVATVTRPPGVDDPLVDRLRLVQIPLDGSPVTHFLLPPGCRVSRQVGSRSLERFAGVLEMDAHEWIGRIALPAANGLSLASQGLFFGPTTGCTSDGAFVGTTSLLGLPIVFRWSDTELGVLRLGLPGCVLPGL